MEELLEIGFLREPFYRWNIFFIPFGNGSFFKCSFGIKKVVA